LTLVIVGTGTDVGKTVVAATLLARYGTEIPLAYWKPIATGSRDGRDTATVEALAGDRAAILDETYLFAEPLSPHLAARLEGRSIEPAVVLADFDRHRAAGRTLVIETAGGLLVPLAGGEEGHDGDGAVLGYGTGGPYGAPALAGVGAAGGIAGIGGAGGMAGMSGAGPPPGTSGAEAGRELGGWPFRLPPPGSSPSQLPGRPGRPGGGAEAGAAAAPSYLQADLLVDMARRAALACLVVAHSGLGTINHTLLTLEALRARGLKVAGVVLDGPPNRENRLAIQRLGGVEAMLELPHLAPLDREEVAAATRHFDRHGHLAPLLRLRRQVSGHGGRPGRPGEGGGGRRGSRRDSRRGSKG
jgi:dethiobiotin synthase